MTSTGSSVRAPSRTLVIVGALAAFVAASLFLAWFALRLTLGQWLLDDALEGAAPSGTSATVVELSLHHAVLADVEIPGLGSIAQVRLDYTPGGLFDGRVESLTLDRPSLSIALEGDGRPGEPLRSWLEGTGAGGGGPPALDQVILQSATLHLESPDAWANVTADGSYQLAGQDGGRLAGTLETPLGTLRAEAELDGWAAGPARRARIVFDAARLGVAGAQVEDLAGKAEVTLKQGLSALLSLQAGATELDGHALGPLTASGTWGAGLASFDMDVGNDRSAATLHLTAGYDSHATDAGWAVSGLLSVASDLDLPLPSPLSVAAPTRLEFSLAGAVPERFDLAHLDGGGTLAVESAGLSGDVLVAGPLSMTLDLALADGGLALSLGGPASVAAIAAGPSPPSWLAALPARSHALAVPADGLHIALTDDGATGYDLEAALDARLDADDGFSVQASGSLALHLDAGGTPVSGGLQDGELVVRGPLAAGIVADELVLSGETRLERGKLQAMLDAEGTLQRVAIGGIQADGVTLALPLRFEQESNVRFRATLDPVAVLGAERLSVAGLTLETVMAELPLSLAWEDEGFTATLMQPGWIDVGAAHHEGFRTVGNTSFKLAADALPLLSLRDRAGLPGWDARLVLEGAATRIELLGSDGTVTATASGTLPSLRLSAGRSGDLHIQSTAESHGGDMTFEEAGVAVSGLELLMSYNDALSPWPQVQAEGLELRDLRTPLRFVTSRIDIALKPVWPQGRDARLTLDLHVGELRYAANVEASWEPDRKKLSAYLRLPPLRFSPQLQPRDLSPLYGSLLTDASGAVEVVGALGLDHGDPFADIDIVFDDLSGSLVGAEVEGIAGRIHVSDIAPLRTPPAQRLSLRRFDPGVPMENLALSFSLPGNGAVWLEAASLDLAGGTVRAQPTTLDPGRAQNRVTLDVADVELARLSALLEMPELEASGRLSGEIPVLLEDGDIAISGGRLATDAPGVLRYVPEGGAAIAGGDENMEMVVTALSNFQYQQIVIDLDRALGGASVVGLHIAGANPELYDGYPIELNVNLTGDLDRIVRDSLAGWRIPEDIRQRLSGF